MTQWNHDISAAPRDGTHVILAMPNKTVLRSYWVECKQEPSHWCMLSHKNEPVAWMLWPKHPFQESPRKAAEAVAEMPALQALDNVPCVAAVERPAVVSPQMGLAEDTVEGQPSVTVSLTAQHGGVNVNGPERAGVTGGESAATSFQVYNRANGESGANASKGVTDGETATHFMLDDAGGGA